MSKKNSHEELTESQEKTRAIYREIMRKEMMKKITNQANSNSDIFKKTLKDYLQDDSPRS